MYMDCAATVAAPIAMAGESDIDLTLKGSLECTTMKTRPSGSSIGKETSRRHIYNVNVEK